MREASPSGPAARRDLPGTTRLRITTIERGLRPNPSSIEARQATLEVQRGRRPRGPGPWAVPAA
eukprot:12381231-Alexandrium_andersonii.AAC.1